MSTWFEIKNWAGKNLTEDKSVLDTPTEISRSPKLTPSVEMVGGDPKDYALSSPTVGPVSIDPTDYIGPGAFAKLAAGLKGVVGAGIFIGVKSTTADIAKQGLAEKLLKAGKSPAEVWKKTGWGIGPDGKWKSEISDKNAKTRDLLLRTREDQVQDILQHPELQKAYPDVMEIPYQEKLELGTGGMYYNYPEKINTGDSDISILLHEVQHPIQEREDFALGAHPKNPDYVDSAGEAEARLTQHRQSLDLKQRLSQYPWEENYFEKATGVKLKHLLINK